MKRRLFRVASVVSILLGLVILVLWTRSYRVYDLCAHEAYSGIGTEIISVSGRLVFYHFNNYPHGNSPPQDFGIEQISPLSRMGRGLLTEYDFSGARHLWNRLGFVAISRPVFGSGTSYVVISTPDWAVVGALSVLPLAGILRRHWIRRIRKRGLAGRCVTCGYNLTGNVSGVCPECGSPIPRSRKR